MFVADQVAELIASCVSNLELAKNKVLEAVAETTAPLRPTTDLLTEISSEDEENAATEIGTVKDAELRSQRKKTSREEEVPSTARVLIALFLAKTVRGDHLINKYV